MLRSVALELLGGASPLVLSWSKQHEKGHPSHRQNRRLLALPQAPRSMGNKGGRLQTYMSRRHNT